EVPRERACCVGQRLAARELQLVRREWDRDAAELRDPGRERDARPGRMLREVEAERRAGEQRLLRLGPELDRAVEDRVRLGDREVGDPEQVASGERDGEGGGHDQRSFAAATAASTSKGRGRAAGASNEPSRTWAATCSC